MQSLVADQTFVLKKTQNLSTGIYNYYSPISHNNYLRLMYTYIFKVDPVKQYLNLVRNNARNCR